jgi:hypothetical protein
MAKRMGIDLGDFNVWMDQVLNPRNKDKRKRLFDRYDLSLRKVEIAQADLEAVVLRHLGKPDFKARILRHGQRIKRLEQEAVSRLRDTLNAYLQDKRP